MIRLFPILICAVTYHCLGMATQCKGQSSRPNVLFIAVDDLNDWIGCLQGHPQALTPNIDRLAHSGVLFSNAHCAAPACTPSRAAVFSGQMPTRTGVWANGFPKLSSLRPNLQQLPTAFKQAGYVTLGTGKLSGDKKTEYDYSYTTEQRWSPFTGDSVDYTDAELPSKGTGNPAHRVNDARGKEWVLPLNRMPSDRRPAENSGESFDWGPLDVPDEDFGDTRITNWAIEKLSDGFDKPFFLGVGYYRPHIPLFAPSRFFERFEGNPPQLPVVTQSDLDDLSDIGKQWALEPITAGSHSTVVKYGQWEEAVAAYLACVTYIDFEIGRLLDALAESGHADNTVVVLWSDHGWHLGEKEHWGKWTGWERSTKVPLIIRPHASLKRVNPNKKANNCSRPVNLVDLYPTLVQLCDLPKPSHALDGESLVPELTDPHIKRRDRGSLSMFGEGNSSLRINNWRIIRYATGEEELYRTDEDPNEWFNLIDRPEYASQREKMAQRLDRRIFDVTPKK